VNADTLTRARRARGLSQKELAAAAGVSSSTIANYESARRVARGAALARIAAALEVTPSAWVPIVPGLLEGVRDQLDWIDDAACADLPQHMFFPGRGEPVSPAQAVCARCAVREECLEYAMRNRITQGVWGGESENSRRLLRRARRVH